MSFKNLRARISQVLREYGFSGYYEQPQINDAGLLTEQFATIDPPATAETELRPKIEPLRPPNNQVVVKSVPAVSKTESIEKIQEGFNRLVGQLENINSHLCNHIEQQQILLDRMQKLPDLLESLPSMAQDQKKVTNELLAQIKAAEDKNEQFMNLMEKIPTETAKQTDCLRDIDHQLTAAANVDVQMAERFNRFNIVLDKMNETSMAQTDSITQMGRTFAASDRYMKYLIQRQNKRFTWIFVATATVCGLAVLILTGIIIYLKH